MSTSEISKSTVGPSATIVIERNTRGTNLTVSVTGSDINTVQAQAEAAYEKLILKYPKGE